MTFPVAEPQVEVLPQNFHPVGFPVDPAVAAAGLGSFLPPHHIPAGQVTQAEFDALEARVAVLEGAP